MFGEDASFSFTLTPGGSLGGPTSLAGTYDYTGGATQGNLTYSETTSSDVLADNCVVPNVVGMAQGAAASALTGAECTVGAVTMASSNSPAGTVISSSPPAGATLEPGAAVALVVSKGGATCKVPDVKGDKLGAAKTKIKHAGCAVGTIKHRETSKKHRGHVLSQSPHAGGDKPAGTKVDLTVGK